MRRAAATVVNHDTVNQASQVASAAPVVPPVDPGLSAHIATVLDAAQHAAHQVKTASLLSVQTWQLQRGLWSCRCRKLHAYGGFVSAPGSAPAAHSHTHPTTLAVN